MKTKVSKNFASSAKYRSVFVLFLIMIAGCSKKIQGSGLVIQVDRDLGEFTEVVLSEQGDLYIDVGERASLVIEAEDNLQAYLVADIENGILDIMKGPDRIQLHATQPIRYYLTVTTLDSLMMKNSGDAEITTVNTDRFHIRISGSGSLQIEELYAAQLDIALTSSGNLKIDDGEVVTQNIILSSSGEYDCPNVVSQNANVHLSSSGDAFIDVREKLAADLSSSGSVYYSGSPSILVADASSSGKVVERP